ncbi:hypothetical protein ACFQ2M_41500 [Kitasatospora saccharophila]|uniref:hypothetical protein n=1 Tax=Kitasatospora saccharophila TaxID=407973 RepID=UPI0036304FD4
MAAHAAGGTSAPATDGGWLPTRIDHRRLRRLLRRRQGVRYALMGMLLPTTSRRSTGSRTSSR